MANYIVTNDGLIDADCLQHYGILGMKWGHRKKYYNSNGTLNKKGVKKFAKKQYAEESLARNKTVLGKMYDRYTGGHKIAGDMLYRMSSDKENRKAANKYLKNKNTKKSIDDVTKTAATVLSGIATATLADKIFYGGKGAEAVKSIMKFAGRATISGIARARGATNIRWYD